MAKRYWLMKTEPDVYSIDDLQRDGVAYWEGVRNYQARNSMRDDMLVGDGVLFYHSNAKPSGVAGLARVARRAYPDHTAFDPESRYHDPKSDPDDPRWLMVDVAYVETFPAVLPLSTLKETPALAEMKVTQKGMRLSIQPVTAKEWRTVVKLGRAMKPAVVKPAKNAAASGAKKKPAREARAPSRGSGTKTLARKRTRARR